MSLTQKGKNTLKVAGIIALVAIVFIAWRGGYLDNRKVTESSTVGPIDLGTNNVSDNKNMVAELPQPTKQAASIKSPTWRQGQMQWESQLAILLANGGINTTKGSLFEKSGIKMNITRQDNCMAGIADIVKCAKAYKTDPNTTEGLQMYNVMFDGSGGFIKNLESQLAELGPQFRPAIIPYFPGRSYGADACWVPRAWMIQGDDGKLTISKDSLRGSVWSVVAKDGDWNVLCNLASITQVPMNWDIGTYDANAINVFNVSDYQQAADAAIADNGRGLTTEFVQKKGKGVGGKITVRVRCFSSWSPEDQQAAEEVGGFYRALSTREFDSEMPCAIITFKKFVDDNHDKLVDMVLALAQAADQIKSYRPALKRAAEAAVEVYGNKDVSYFLAMYNGSPIKDAQGENIEVGGNRVMNLADNMEFFGLADGSYNTAQKVYKLYADIIAKNYPADMPGGPVPFAKVINTDILQEAFDKSQNPDAGKFITNASMTDFSQKKEMSTVVGSANYQITFATNSAEILPENEEILNKILDNTVSGSNTLIQINGYTDSDGTNEINVPLSKRRAQAVADWLKKHAPNVYKGHRLDDVNGYGSANPIASNNTNEGKKKNRRVEIKLGSNN